MKRTIPIYIIALLATACGDRHQPNPTTANSAFGPCTLNEPGATPVEGAASYSQSANPTANDQPASHAITLACTAPGPLGDQLAIILPNLPTNPETWPGRYQVTPLPQKPTAVDSHTAWVQLTRTLTDPTILEADAGHVDITTATDGLLTGTYYVTLANTASPNLNTVIGGGFEAPDRTEATTQ